MLLRTLYDESLAQASYLLGCQRTGEALVIDPNRSIDQYRELAQQKGLRITAVTETHIHADFVSGARELAHQTGAQLYLSDMGPADWKYAYAAEAGAILLQEGDTFSVGNILVQVLHTPGHTPEHLSFLITDSANADEPMGIFTGDFLFVGDVGRPDLLERVAQQAGSMDEGARQLFQSLQKIRALPDYLQVWPGHGAGSACGRSLGAIPQTTIGYERRFNWALSIEDVEAFTRSILAGQPEPPTYFAQMKQINKQGPALLGTVATPPVATIEQLQQQLEQQQQVIDTRPADAYAREHIAGTINLPLNGSFLNWAGWLLSYERPLTLIADPETLPEVQRLLSLIGLDQIANALPPSILQDWQAVGKPLQSLRKESTTVIQTRILQEKLPVIDVRGADEYAAGHLEGALNIPLGQLAQRLQELPQGQEFVVHCQRGARSAIASSILASHGVTGHIDMSDGFAGWEAAGLPVTHQANDQ